MAVAFPNERIFILYLLSAFVLAFLSWLYYRRLEKNKRPEKLEGKGPFSYIFDKNVYLHKSAIQDYVFFFVNAAIYMGIVSQLLISTHFFTIVFYDGLQGVFGTDAAGVIAPSIWTLIGYTLVYTLLLDFAIFITHYAQHKIPILWEFHKVHHSAEVLTPITLYRMHPVDLFFSGIVASLLAGLGFAGFYFVTGEAPKAYEIMGINIMVFAFYLFGYNLRHSHIWLSYPQWLSHILISPAQHQIHHSIEVRHYDKNLGLIFAFWDKLFGTLYVPKSYESFAYGINKKKPNPFNNVREMYLMPFKKAWKIIHPDEKANERAFYFALVSLFCVLGYAAFYSIDLKVQAENAPLPSVHIEDLTWTEVHRSLHEKGYDTIIIPTGGTEQNGPHVILGKHNYVVRYTTGEIAERLGETLVAPVMAYVPEEDHMPWPGTVSVSEKVFADLLTSAAESYVAHGFKNILFIGDSGGNQETQDKVARKLNKKWRKDNITVAHIDNYYSGHDQTGWLLERGYTQEEIGNHAGIRDTSEMKFVHPDGVRRYPRMVEDQSTGFNGRPDFARRKIGRHMTELKINAALEQIRSLLGKDQTVKELDETMPARPYR